MNLDRNSCYQYESVDADRKQYSDSLHSGFAALTQMLFSHLFTQREGDIPSALTVVVSTILFANPNVREILILIRTDFLVLLNPLFPTQWLEGQNIAIVCPIQPFGSQLVYHFRVSGGYIIIAKGIIEQVI